MITVKTEIKRNRVQFSWDKRIKGLKGKNLWMEYDVDISNMPRYLANLMFGLIVADPLSWENKTMIFDELTPEGLSGLNSFLKMYYYSKGCGGLYKGYNRIYPKVLGASFGTMELYDADQRESNGPVLCANGLGKDGLTIASMVKELGFDMRCFFLDGQMGKKLMIDRIDTMNKFYKMKSIESNIIKSNFFKIQGKRTGIYPYFFAIPLAHHYESEAILAGISIHLSKTKGKYGLYCPGESIFAFDYATKASGINFSSPHRPLSLYLVEKILVDRYPDMLELQRSCMEGSPWCNKCMKCYRHHLWLKTIGFDPELIGLSPPGVGIWDFYSKKQTSAYGASRNTAINVLNKLGGGSYQKWIEGVNKPALDLIWRGREFEKIFQEHFDFYKYDPGDDGYGWMLEPSKWHGCLEKGFVNK